MAAQEEKYVDTVVYYYIYSRLIYKLFRIMF